VEIFSDPVYVWLHDDPRRHTFLQKVGETRAQLAAIEFNVQVPDFLPRSECSAIIYPLAGVCNVPAALVSPPGEP